MDKEYSDEKYFDEAFAGYEDETLRVEMLEEDNRINNR